MNRLHLDEEILHARGDIADAAEDLGNIAGLLRQAHASMSNIEKAEILKTALDITNDLLETAAELKSTVVDHRPARLGVRALLPRSVPARLPHDRGDARRLHP